jgi:hypothetical protein
VASKRSRRPELAADPQDEAAEDEHEQPAGDEFGIEPAGVAEVQVAVHLPEPDLGRRFAGHGDEPAVDGAGVRVDVDGEVLGAERVAGVFEAWHGQHHLGGPVR